AIDVLQLCAKPAHRRRVKADRKKEVTGPVPCLLGSGPKLKLRPFLRCILLRNEWHNVSRSRTVDPLKLPLILAPKLAGATRRKEHSQIAGSGEVSIHLAYKPFVLACVREREVILEAPSFHRFTRCLRVLRSASAQFAYARIASRPSHPAILLDGRQG